MPPHGNNTLMGLPCTSGANRRHLFSAGLTWLQASMALCAFCSGDRTWLAAGCVDTSPKDVASRHCASHLPSAPNASRLPCHGDWWYLGSQPAAGRSGSLAWMRQCHRFPLLRQGNTSLWAMFLEPHIQLGERRPSIADGMTLREAVPEHRRKPV